MANRSHGARHIKRLHTYDVRQAAKATGATAGTVRQWHKAHGLESVTGVWPLIFRGADIIAFFKKRNAGRKQRCGPGRIFCLRCKAPKTPALGEVDYRADTPNRGALIGLCPDCEGLIYRRTSPRNLAAAKGSLKVSMPSAESRLAKSAGDETKWPEHIEAARADLTKADEPAKAETETKEPAAKAASPVDGEQWEQVWLCKRDGKHFKTKADLRAHLAALDAEEATKSATGGVINQLNEIGAKLGVEKAVEPAKAAIDEKKVAAKSTCLAELKKWIGEEVCDSSYAISALASIFDLLRSEVYDDEPDAGQIAALQGAIERLKAFIVSEIQEDNSETRVLAMAAEAGDLAKKGARNSKSDQDKIQKAHDTLVEAGATCSTEKHAHAAGLAKGLDDDLAATALEKVTAERDSLMKAIDEKIVPMLTDIAKRVKTIEETPLPLPLSTGARFVTKAEDSNRGSDAESSLEKMLSTQDGRDAISTALIKAAQQSPQR